MLYIAIFIFGCSVGFFTACCLSASKISDLENEIYKLRGDDNET